MALAEEELPGQPLLREIMRDGRRIAELPPLHSSREYFLAQLADLPSALRKLDDGGGAHYPVRISDRVRALARMADAANVDMNTKPTASVPDGPV